MGEHHARGSSGAVDQREEKIVAPARVGVRAITHRKGEWVVSGPALSLEQPLAGPQMKPGVLGPHLLQRKDDGQSEQNEEKHAVRVRKRGRREQQASISRAAAARPHTRLRSCGAHSPVPPRSAPENSIRCSLGPDRHPTHSPPPSREGDPRRGLAQVQCWPEGGFRGPGPAPAE